VQRDAGHGLGLPGCEGIELALVEPAPDDPPRLSRIARSVLLSASPVASAAALASFRPEQRWMLNQPREIRRSFVAEVVDAGGTRLAQERWMLLQDDDVRASYADKVLLVAPHPDRTQIWMLGQPRAVRESYVRDVLDAASE
jgi:hypothetical protein